MNKASTLLTGAPFIDIFLWMVAASFLLSKGADLLARRLGEKFVGRTVLSITTTLPEIVIVATASRLTFYGTSWALPSAAMC